MSRYYDEDLDCYVEDDCEVQTLLLNVITSRARIYSITDEKSVTPPPSVRPD